METRLGVGKVDITPVEPVPLCGFGNRKGPLEGVTRRLYARVWLFEQTQALSDEKRHVLLVEADIIWWPPERMDIIRQQIKEKLNIEDEGIILSANHTHGGPQTTNRFLPLLGGHVEAYTEYLESKLLEGIDEALRTLEPVRMDRGRGQCFFGIHRRVMKDGKITMAPNPDVPVDHEVTVLRFRTGTGALKGVLFHYTCHSTTTNSMKVTSEYPGAAMELLEESFGGGAIAAFLQGCTGDVRPALHRDGRFYSGTDDDVTRLGRELADEVQRVLSGPMEEIPLAPFETRSVTVDLPFQELPTREELTALLGKPERWGEWSQILLEHPERVQPSIPLHLTLIRLGEQLGFLALDGEIVLGYGNYIKQRSQGEVLPLGYSNGMVGYVPTAVQVEEGGYEGRESFPLFSLPAAFDPALEEKIKQGIDKLL